MSVGEYWPSSLYFPQTCPRWRSPRHTLPNRLMRSHCSRLMLSWSYRKRTVSVDVSHLSGCQPDKGAECTGVQRELPQRTGLGRWLSWHKDLILNSRAHIKGSWGWWHMIVSSHCQGSRHANLKGSLTSSLASLASSMMMRDYLKRQWAAPEELGLSLGLQAHRCMWIHTRA